MPTAPVNSDQTKQLFDVLSSRLRGDVFTDSVRKAIYATDASHYQLTPVCVVVPRDEADVVATMEAARQMNVPITGRGGGTSLAGQTFGTGIIIDFSKYMNQVLEIDAEHRRARVQPGIIRDHLNKQLKPHGLHFAPDPATTSRAAVGGMIGNNSSGTRSIVYGKTIDHVLALRVLLSDGTICRFDAADLETWQQRESAGDRESDLYRGVAALVDKHRGEIEHRFPKVMRRVSGYNLDELLAPNSRNFSRLICGSEGTLGLILEAEINLEPLPKATALCIVHFDDLIDSLRPVPTMLEHGPSAVELLDRSILDEARTNPSCKQFAGFIEGDPEAVQIVEFFGDSPTEAQSRAQRFADDMAAKQVGYARVLRTDPARITEVWELRRLGVGLQSNVKGATKPLDFVDDACVPVDKLAEYIEKLRDICTKHGVSMPVCAHASVGVLHPKPALDLHKPEDRDKMRSIAREAFELVKSYGGAWSGEHGDGLVRGEFIRDFFGEELYAAFREVKRLFDPAGLLNPGKILDTPSMTDNLRHGTPDYELRIAEVKPNFHYRDQGGFALAVEQCNGLGACRKVDTGTMCPSYMATRDEETSTRGRANALRMAMSGQLGDDDLTSDGVADVLSLCLSCKACKSECPNKVDMARLKSDVMQMRHDKLGLPLGKRLIGDSPRASRLLAGPLAPIVNAVQSLVFYRRLMSFITKTDPRRAFPAYASKPLHKQLKHRRKKTDAMASTKGSLGKVVLFNDTYMNYHEPHIGLRAIDLLEGCGYEVVLANAGCCQRPRLSVGMVHAAKRDGAATLRNLLPHAQAGLPILFTEPSCYSAVKDDLPDLIDEAELGKTVADRSFMLEDFLAAELDAGRIAPVFEALTDRVLVHGHCHQKAVSGTGGLNKLLSSTPGLTVEEIDAGCCGMAGSFGYEYYDVSMKVGSSRLFPAAKRAGEQGAAVCSNGFSCRHQLADGTGTKGKHLVELIRIKS